MNILDLLPDAVVPSEAETLTPLHMTARMEEITPKTLFFLTEGTEYDKRKLIPFILAKKPLAIVISTEIKAQDTQVPLIYVDNVRRAYAMAFYRFYGLQNTKMKFIAVTGTNGKTTTATLLTEILKKSGYKIGSIGTGKIVCDNETLSSRYYSMTTPDPEILYPVLKKMDIYGCDIVVMEASSHALALEKLAPLFFEIAIFTNLSAEHLDFHKDMENYFRAKSRLFLQAKCAIINNDDPYGRRLADLCTCKKQLVGALFPCETMAKNVESHGLGGCSYMYSNNSSKFFVHLSIPGIYHIYNSMLAINAAISLGIKPCDAKKHIESIEVIPGRLNCIAKSDVSVYVDYAHTPQALASALKESQIAKSKGHKLWLIFGCGGERDREKRPKMASIAEKGADRVILTLDNCRNESPMQILKDTIVGFQNRKKAQVISDRTKAIRTAILSMKKGDTLIIAGKGHEAYSIDKSGYHPFDERKIILSALKERKDGHTVQYENQTDTASHGARN